VGQEVKEADRDLSVVCPGRQLNYGGQGIKTLSVWNRSSRGVCEWGSLGGLCAGILFLRRRKRKIFIFGGDWVYL
jgi:hypothetical protein